MRHESGEISDGIVYDRLSEGEKREKNYFKVAGGNSIWLVIFVVTIIGTVGMIP